MNCGLFNVSVNNISLIKGRHHCRWRAAKSRPMLGACNFEQGGNFIVPDLMWNTLSHPEEHPLSSPLMTSPVYWGSILTRILMATFHDETLSCHQNLQKKRPSPQKTEKKKTKAKNNTPAPTTPHNQTKLHYSAIVCVIDAGGEYLWIKCITLHFHDQIANIIVS